MFRQINPRRIVICLLSNDVLSPILHNVLLSASLQTLRLCSPSFNDNISKVLKQLFITVWTCLVCMIEKNTLCVCVRLLRGAKCSFSQVSVFARQYLWVLYASMCVFLCDCFLTAEVYACPVFGPVRQAWFWAFWQLKPRGHAGVIIRGNNSN